MITNAYLSAGNRQITLYLNQDFIFFESIPGFLHSYAYKGSRATYFVINSNLAKIYHQIGNELNIEINHLSISEFKKFIQSQAVELKTKSITFEQKLLSEIPISFLNENLINLVIWAGDVFLAELGKYSLLNKLRLRNASFEFYKKFAFLNIDHFIIPSIFVQTRTFLGKVTINGDLKLYRQACEALRKILLPNILVDNLNSTIFIGISSEINSRWTRDLFSKLNQIDLNTFSKIYLKFHPKFEITDRVLTLFQNLKYKYPSHFNQSFESLMDKAPLEILLDSKLQSIYIGDFTSAISCSRPEQVNLIKRKILGLETWHSLFYLNFMNSWKSGTEIYFKNN